MKAILFNTAMVRAILDGEKTCTRRIIKRTPSNDTPSGFGFWREFNETDKKWYIKDYTHGCVWWEENEYIRKFSKFHVGNILYVRETFAKMDSYIDENGNEVEGETVFYRANELDEQTLMTFDYVDGDGFSLGRPYPWTPSIHMPKRLARLFLKVTSIKVERLKDITDEGCYQEGISSTSFYDEAEHIQIAGIGLNDSLERAAFSLLWNSTVKEEKYSWEGNPWVWVIEFERVEKGE
ncbi:MAG: hypothetical protein E7J58_11520 [Bacillota bacterium]|jgi:hypothetical protein|nr:hypothetical protein [Clostridium perfringens]MDU7782778.1 hypothetical protein [Clostridium perfringens]MDU7817278.1 hypothetical protein [Bacillota bacterium]DAL65963.1 MAG TPA_asm: ASCH domain protein [Caudoviricetes sp.]